MTTLDELFPVPSASPLGVHDSLTKALRRTLAVAVLVLFLLTTLWLLLLLGPENRGHARQLTETFFGWGREVQIELRADR